MERKKKTTKKSLGMKPIPEKPLTKRQQVFQDARMMKQLEMAKPVAGICDELWDQIRRLEGNLFILRQDLLLKAKIATEEGYRFESFIYIKESLIPDQEEMARIYELHNEPFPMKEVIDWRAMATSLKADGAGICPMKKKTAYLREVKPI